MSESQSESVAAATSGSKGSTMSPYVRQSLDKVAIAEGFVNYDIDFNASSAVGDGFIGIIFKAVISENESDKKLGVIVKSPPVSQERRIQFDVMPMFEREVFAYKNVFPEFVKIQEEKSIEIEKRFTKFPKCYFAEFDSEKDESIIILEDLRERNFILCNKTVPASFENTKLVFTALGRLHALSFAFKTLKPETFETFQKLKDTIALRLHNDNFRPSMLLLIDRAVESLDEKDLDSRKRVLKLKEDFEATLIELCDSDASGASAVLGHGDCWSNNFMYKFQKGVTSDIVMLDWQALRYVSPALDLVQFIFVCTDSDMRANHYDELLKIYHNSLSDLLNSLGGDAETQFPFQALLDQLKKFGKFGVIVSVILIPILLTKDDDFPDLDVMAEEMEAKPNNFNETFAANDDVYKTRMRSVLTDAIRYGYL